MRNLGISRWTLFFLIATTEAHHYRRIAVQRLQAHMSEASICRTPISRGFGIRDGNGVVFVSHQGEVYPSGFLPLSAGNIRTRSLVQLYRHSPLFQTIRDTEQLTGKCGECAYRLICGGSRARAYAATGDPMASDPLCPYEPPQPQVQGTPHRTFSTPIRAGISIALNHRENSLRLFIITVTTTTITVFTLRSRCRLPFSLPTLSQTLAFNN